MEAPRAQEPKLISHEKLSCLWGEAAFDYADPKNRLGRKRREEIQNICLFAHNDKQRSVERFSFRGAHSACPKHKYSALSLHTHTHTDKHTKTHRSSS